MELWIDSLLEQRRVADADAALASILEQVPPVWRKFAAQGLETWNLARAPREQQLARLELLAIHRPELAVPLVLSFTREELQRELQAFEVVDGKLRSEELGARGRARLLAKLGIPEVGPALERAKERCSEDQRDLVDSFHESWSKANARWKLLAGEDP